MKILNLVQGSEEWLAARKSYFTASEAAAMLGLCKQQTRSQLLHAKVTGTAKEYSDYVQKHILDAGHEVEAMARPIVEAAINDELYPATGTKEVDGLHLLASFDGLTMDWETGFEHKQLNKELIESIKNGVVPDTHWPQLEQQLLISGAERFIFTVSDGTEEYMHRLDYRSHPDRRAKLIAGWKQFKEDLENYKPREIKEAPKAEVKQELPTLLLEISGEVKNTNIVEFKQCADSFIANINTELNSDQDFANAEADVKRCKAAEQQLEAASKSALSQTASIENVLLTIEEVKAKLRETRLHIDKLVKSRKEDIKKAEIQRGIQALAQHHAQLSESIGVDIDITPADFAGAAKNKRTMASLVDSIDTCLANAKIKLNETAELYRANLQLIPAEFSFLFNDKSQILNKPTHDFANLVQVRIAEHEERERVKREAEEARKSQVEVETQTNKSEPSSPARTSSTSELSTRTNQVKAESQRSFSECIDDWVIKHQINKGAELDLYQILSDFNINVAKRAA